MRSTEPALTPKRERRCGLDLDYIDCGTGKTALVMHSSEGPTSFSERYIRNLSRHYRVIAPWHPGFGNSERPVGFSSADDLAYFYLDLADELELQDAILIGASFGGWLAAEAAVRSTKNFSHLVLVDPLGIKIGGREDRDIVDIHSLTSTEWLETAFADPAAAQRDYASMSDEQIAALARSRESLVRFGWRPYMHNPRLKRWLHRIKIPTLVVRGAMDAVVSENYHRTFAELIPHAEFRTITNAGHYPHIERADEFSALVFEFVSQHQTKRPLSA